jgi:hydrogenase/urease accessory protein HupE
VSDFSFNIAVGQGNFAKLHHALASRLGARHRVNKLNICIHVRLRFFGVERVEVVLTLQTILSIGGVQKAMSPGQTQDYDPQAVTANLLGNIRDFAVWGAEHIFTGPDHILFILALLLVSTSFKSLVKTLSGFTLAHSVTLVLTTLGVVSSPARLVDIVVALSIVYVGLENVFRKNFRHRFVVASAFGLIHGFAFASNLRDIGLPDEGVGWCLLSFNLGVEIGQVTICALAYPIMVAFRCRMNENANLGGDGIGYAV